MNKFSLKVESQDQFNTVLEYIKNTLGYSNLIPNLVYTSDPLYIGINTQESNKDYYINTEDKFQDFERITFDEFKNLIQ